MGYLVDIILTRDTWMHRADIAKATGKPMELTREHDGRIVADAAAEWGRLHGQPCTLHLTGPVGGTFTQGDGGEEITIDAVDFCRILSGRGTGEGLLAQQVPLLDARPTREDASDRFGGDGLRAAAGAARPPGGGARRRPRRRRAGGAHRGHVDRGARSHVLARARQARLARDDLAGRGGWRGPHPARAVRGVRGADR